MSNGFEKALVAELDIFLHPLIAATKSPQALHRLLVNSGWSPAAISNVEIFQATVGDIMSAYAAISAVKLPIENLEQVGPLLDALGALNSCVKDLKNVKSAAAGAASTNVAVLEGLGSDLLNQLGMLYLTGRSTRIFQLMVLATLIDVEEPGDQPMAKGRIPRRRYRFHLERLKALVQSPGAHLSRYYAPHGITEESDAQQFTDLLFPRIAALLETFGVSAVYGLPAKYVSNPSDPAIGLLRRMMTLNVPVDVGVSSDGTSATSASLGVGMTVSAKSTKSRGLLLFPRGAFSKTLALPSGWSLALDVDAAVPAVMINSSGVQMASDKGAVQSCHASFVFSRGSGKDPGFMVGGATGSNLQVQDVSFSLKGGYSKDSKAPAENDVSVELKFDKGQLVISPGDGDGFIKKIFGGAKPDPINFDLGIGWSYQKGFHFTGSADFTKKIPVGLNLGDVLKIDSVLLALGASNDGIHANASTTALVSLGPVAATVSEFGLGLNLDFKDDSKGNLGPLHARLGFKAPTKVALSIDADVVSGAGEIDYDDAAKRYAGLLHLEFESFALNAMGALDTKLPGGVDGYSLIVMISTEFDDGIPLGEGFSLNGFGGIVGINRSVSTSELQNAVLAGKISDIMFPEIDPKKDTSQILSRLTAIFPPTEGKYVFAPLVEIDWGAEEQFIFGQLGLVVELPQLEHIALIGHFDAYFPTPDPDKRLLELHLDVAGMLDRPAKYLQILCDIHDSKFKGISIYGDILVRYSWGDDPEFVLSIGGFHPAFHPPAGLPALKRLGLEMGNGDALKIGVQSYLAITTNSFQFGVAGQFVFKEGSFKVVGGIAFNTLIIFTPFHFSADFSAGMSVSYKDYDFASLWVTANVEGPHQWHVWGSVSVSLFFFDLSYSFDKRWGEVDTKVVVQPKVADELLAALNDAKNMASVPPIEYAPVVRFDGPPKDGAPFYVNPAHGISIRQKVAPLGLRLSKFHEVPLTTPVQFDLPAKSTDGQLPLSPLLGQFATGQYQVLSQAQALSSPSFEPRVAGFAFGDDRVATADATPAATRYVTEYDVSVQGTPPPVALKAADLEWMIRGGAAARFRQRGAGARKFMPAQGKLTKVSVGQELYFVVKKSDLTKITAQALPYDQAELQLKSHLAAPGGWRDDADLMIVPDYELSA